MAGHSTWRVTGSRITGAVPEEVRAGQSRPPDLAYTGQMRSRGQFGHAASSSFTASLPLEIRSAASTPVVPGVFPLAVPAGSHLRDLRSVSALRAPVSVP